jgi:hypothetical protein
MPLGNPKKKTHKIYVNEGQNKEFINMLIRHKVFEKQKKHFKRTFENKIQI